MTGLQMGCEISRLVEENHMLDKKAVILTYQLNTDSLVRKRIQGSLGNQ